LIVVLSKIVKNTPVADVVEAICVLRLTPFYSLILNQGCQTFGPRGKSGPLRGWILPAG